MAARIAGGPFDLAVWNRDVSKAERLASEIGALVCSSIDEAAARSQVVITSLADDAAVESVYLGEGGIVSGVRTGAVVVDTSTIDPETSRRVGGALDASGAGFLDAPVSGSVATAEAGNLTVMVGGDAGSLEIAAAVLETFASRIVPVGGRGSGAVTKLAVNALVHGLNVSLSEALVLAERAGVDRHIAYEIFASGAGGAPFVHYKRQAFEDPAGTPVAFSLDLVAKDLDLITTLARRVSAPIAQTEATAGIVSRAVAAGLGPRDMSAVAGFLRGGE